MRKKIPNHKPSQVLRLALYSGIYTDGNNSMEVAIQKLVADKRVLRKDAKAVSFWVNKSILKGHMFNFYARDEGLLPKGMGEDHPEYASHASNYWCVIINRLREAGR